MPASAPEADGPSEVPSAESYLRRAPKVELHVHLEGAVRPQRLLAVLQRHGLHTHLRRPEDVAWLFHHDSFVDFLEHFRFVVTSLRDVQDVHDVARDLFEELAAQQVLYAEVLFSAAIFVRLGMPWDELLAAVSEAEAAVLEPRRRGGSLPRYNLVLDLVRNFGPEFAAAQVEEIAKRAHPRVVGVHLGGDEVNFPARLFAAAYARAGEAGLGRAAHAGEGAGAASVREAVEELQVTRIGHGIRCLEDPELVHLLVERGITLEVCPTSNVRTRVVSELQAHPLPLLLSQGLRCTIGSDDPSFFDTDLSREWIAAHRVLGLGLRQLDACADAGLEAAFLPQTEREVGLARLRAERAASRAELGLSG